MLQLGIEAAHIAGLSRGEGEKGTKNGSHVVRFKQSQPPFTLPERVLLALGMAPTGTVVLVIRSIGPEGLGQ